MWASITFLLFHVKNPLIFTRHTIFPLHFYFLSTPDYCRHSVHYFFFLHWTANEVAYSLSSVVIEHLANFRNSKCQMRKAKINNLFIHLITSKVFDIRKSFSSWWCPNFEITLNLKLGNSVITEGKGIAQ